MKEMSDLRLIILTLETMGEVGGNLSFFARVRVYFSAELSTPHL